MKLQHVFEIETEERGCGFRDDYGMYAVGGTESSENGTLAIFSLVAPPVPYQVPIHRSPRIVDANAILGRLPIEDWWAGASKETEIKKAGDQWAINIFGMSISKRIEIGECEGSSSPDEALSILVSKITFSDRIADIFRQITRDDIQEIKLVAAPYNQFHEAVSAFSKENLVTYLMAAQAAIWKMAYGIPPTKRNIYISNLARILILMGLRKDAAAMQRMFT